MLFINSEAAAVDVHPDYGSIGSAPTCWDHGLNATSKYRFNRSGSSTIPPRQLVSINVKKISLFNLYFTQLGSDILMIALLNGLSSPYIAQIINHPGYTLDIYNSDDVSTNGFTLESWMGGQ